MKSGNCLCGSSDTRLYACGWRCAEHTPAKLAGRPEPGEGRYCPPAICYCGNCPSWRGSALKAPGESN